MYITHSGLNLDYVVVYDRYMIVSNDKWLFVNVEIKCAKSESLIMLVIIFLRLECTSVKYQRVSKFKKNVKI